MNTLTVYVTDETLPKALEFVASHAPKLGERMIDGQIRFAWDKGLSGKTDASVTVFNEQGTLKGVLKNVRNSRSKKPKRLSDKGIARKVRPDPVEQAILCTGSCAATLEMIDRWVKRWRTLLADNDCTERDSLEGYIQAHKELSAEISFLVSLARKHMQDTGRISENGVVQAQSTWRLEDKHNGFEYAWLEEIARQKAWWVSRREDIRKLDAAYGSHDNCFDNCADGATAFKKYRHMSCSMVWLNRLVTAYADALGDRSGLDALAEWEETQRLAEEARKAKVAQKRRRR
ncbi:MAG: hypothetical protein FWH21_00900 [Kiritimatiellaeota bacterium]|nr:hypothetical protein [Kiritimatiellota bacterium]